MKNKKNRLPRDLIWAFGNLVILARGVTDYRGINMKILINRINLFFLQYLQKSMMSFRKELHHWGDFYGHLDFLKFIFPLSSCFDHFTFILPSPFAFLLLLLSPYICSSSSCLVMFSLSFLPVFCCW